MEFLDEAKETLDRIVCRNDGCFESIKEDKEFGGFLNLLVDGFNGEEEDDGSKQVEKLVKPRREPRQERPKRPEYQQRPDRPERTPY